VQSSSQIIITNTPTLSLFYRLDALPATQHTAVPLCCLTDGSLFLDINSDAGLQWTHCVILADGKKHIQRSKSMHAHSLVSKINQVH